MTERRRALSLAGLFEVAALFAGAFGLAAPIAWVGCRLPGAPWWAELPAHFFDHAGLGLAFATAVLLRGRLPLRAHLGFVVALVTLALWPFFPARYGPPPVAPAPAPISLLVANVHTSNRDFGALLALARDRDVVGLLEVDRGWAEAVVAGLPEHRLLASSPRSDNFGVMLLAKLPGATARIVELGERLPSVEAELPLGEARVTLLLTHPLPPISEDYAQSRDRQLRALAARVRELGPRVVVTGDLNATLRVPALEPLLQAGLRDGREGHGRLGSWPAPLGPFGIPIDHLLLGDALAAPTLDARAFGSDHRALLFTLAVRAGATHGG